MSVSVSLTTLTLQGCITARFWRTPPGVTSGLLVPSSVNIRFCTTVVTIRIIWFTTTCLLPTMLVAYSLIHGTGWYRLHTLYACILETFGFSLDWGYLLSWLRVFIAFLIVPRWMPFNTSSPSKSFQIHCSFIPPDHPTLYGPGSECS